MKIKAAVLRKYNEPLSVEELELEPPKEKEVLVKYAFTGFCHSDLHNIFGHTRMPTPMIQGHEAIIGLDIDFAVQALVLVILVIIGSKLYPKAIA